jgi:hypothetical protein
MEAGGLPEYHVWPSVNEPERDGGGVMRFRMASVFLVLSSLGVGACASSRGTLPSPPLDGDLVNDGSANQQRVLEERFAINSSAGSHRIGNAVRTRHGPALPTDVERYLRSDPDASEALGPRWSRSVGPVVAVGGLVATSAVGLVLAAVAMGGSVGLLFALHSLDRPAHERELNAALFEPTPGNGFRGIALVLAALTMLAVATPAIVVQLSSLVVDGLRERAAINRFNSNLRRRISGAASNPRATR